MTEDQFAALFKQQGYRVFRSASCWWYSPYPGVFNSIPFHRAPAVEAPDLRHLFLRGPAAVVRFPRTNGGGYSGGIFVCRDRDYDLRSLTHQPRNRTMRGLKNCEVRRMEFAELEHAGYGLVSDTFSRQGRQTTAQTVERWRKSCAALAGTPDAEAWGAFVEGSLASFVTLALVDGQVTFLQQCSAHRFLDLCPNNALYFTVTRHSLARPEVNGVCAGWDSIEEKSSLTRFKIGMGYELQPVKMEIVFHPLLRCLLACGGRRGIAAIAKRHVESDFWRKAERLLDLRNHAGAQ